MKSEADAHMEEAIRLSLEAVRSGRGGPFGCVIVRAGRVIGRGENRVTSANDPTAHAEIVAIREACRNAGRFHLEDAALYTSCEPCPMCLAAVYWARIPEVYYANTRTDAAAIGFGDDFIYGQMPLPPAARALKMRPLLREAAQAAFREWTAKADRIPY
ncbi:MAG: nucleoside deaminase [Opitutaceae bacterium]